MMKAIRIEHEIQIGESTHHHDHAITPDNFKVIKMIRTTPTGPTEAGAGLSFFIVKLLIIYRVVCCCIF
jgi:hypothetical protein